MHLSKEVNLLYDKGGYFVINGVERVIVAQERMARNRIYVLWNKQPSKYTYVAQIQSMGVKGTRFMYVRVLYGSKSKGCIRCTLPFIKSDIPIVLVFRALGISIGREIVKLICHDLNDTEMMNFLWPSLEEAEEFEDQQAALDYIGRKCATDHENEENMRRHARDILQKEMLPHVRVDDNCETKKAYYLGYVIHRLLLCALGRRREDDRDRLSNTRLDLAGPLLAELFRKLFKNLTHRITSYVQKHANANKEVNLESAIVAKMITDGFDYALSTGSWGPRSGGENRVGLSQVLNRTTYLSSLSDLRRSSIRPEGKLVVKPRQLHTSQWGMMCPVETPNIDSCGLVKNLTLMVYITAWSESVTGMIKMDCLTTIGFQDLQNPNLEPTALSSKTKVFINGEWIGLTTFSPAEFASILKKRKASVDRDSWYIGIIEDKSLKEVRINTDSGRCTRPLLTVANQRLLITEKVIKVLMAIVSMYPALKVHLVDKMLRTKC